MRPEHEGHAEHTLRERARLVVVHLGGDEVAEAARPVGDAGGGVRELRAVAGAQRVDAGGDVGEDVAVADEEEVVEVDDVVDGEEEELGFAQPGVFVVAHVVEDVGRVGKGAEQAR